MLDQAARPVVVVVFRSGQQVHQVCKVDQDRLDVLLEHLVGEAEARPNAGDQLGLQQEHQISATLAGRKAFLERRVLELTPSSLAQILDQVRRKQFLRRMGIGILCGR
ncbi:hypothetical protein D9M68_989800 [compost metagenome]